MSNIQYIIVGGFPRSGKSTFVSYCREILGENYTLDISTVDLVKSLAVKAGWDGTKTPKNRKFLSDLKQLLIEWDDIPYKDVIKTAQNKREDLDAYGITHTLYVVISLSFVGISWSSREINTVCAPTLSTNESDITTYKYDYETTIFNNGDLMQLKSSAQSYITSIT